MSVPPLAPVSARIWDPHPGALQCQFPLCSHVSTNNPRVDAPIHQSVRSDLRIALLVPSRCPCPCCFLSSCPCYPCPYLCSYRPCPVLCVSWPQPPLALVQSALDPTSSPLLETSHWVHALSHTSSGFWALTNMCVLIAGGDLHVMMAPLTTSGNVPRDIVSNS